MKVLALLIAFVSLGVAFAEDKKKEAPVPPVLQFKMKSLTGETVDLSKYQGKVILMVNTASKCGFTPQYKGLVVLGFPANDFKQQEPGSDQDIATFCQQNYGVTFDMFSKIVVTGVDKAPLYKYLTEASTDPKHAGEVKWNFEKFLIAKDGSIANRFVSKVKPSSDEVVNAIEAELAK